MTTPGVEYWTGQQYGWRYLAQRIDGSGTPGEWLDNELPLVDVTVTDVLSGPPQIQATIDPVQARLLGADGKPRMYPWRTVIHAEQDGQIRGSAILVTSGYSGPKWALDCSGFSGYAAGMPYDGEIEFVETDPLDLARHIWLHIQGGQDSNLGMVLDPWTVSPVRLGKALVPDENGNLPTSSSTDEGPYRLAWWANDDLGKDLDDLAKNTPFDYHERHVWNTDKTAVEHYLDFGYPRIGRRQEELRFILGENIQTVPDIDEDGTDFASDVRFLGAGEGSSMIMGRSTIRYGGLRRCITVDDKSIADSGRAYAEARREMARRLFLVTTPSVVVRNTPNAPLGAWSVGDEIRVQAEEEWRAVDLWFRVLTITISPENPDLIAMTLLRSDLV
jgi:hypothetical protein